MLPSPRANQATRGNVFSRPAQNCRTAGRLEKTARTTWRIYVYLQPTENDSGKRSRSPEFAPHAAQVSTAEITKLVFQISLSFQPLHTFSFAHSLVTIIRSVSARKPPRPPQNHRPQS